MAPSASAIISRISATEPVYLPDMTKAPYSPAASRVGSIVTLSATPKATRVLIGARADDVNTRPAKALLTWLARAMGTPR